MYADQVTDSMRRMIDVTNERRVRQLEYNRTHGITPRTVQKAIQDSLAILKEAEKEESLVVREAGVDYDVPFGGRKGSSYGPREQGRYAAEFLKTVKTAYTAA